MKSDKGVSVLSTFRFALLLCGMVFFLGACGAPKEPNNSAPTGEMSSSVGEETQEKSEAKEMPPTQTKLRLAALKGPTSMGMAYVLSSSEQGETVQESRILGAPDEIVPLLLKKEIDVAAVPSNLAAVLYAKTKGDIQVLNINTLGVLYLVERGERIHTMEDIKGKTVLASGKGSAPEFVLRYLLEANGLSIEDISLEWKSEHTEVVAALAENEDAIALLPEPFVSSAEAQFSDFRRALDLTAEWEAVQHEENHPSALVMGVLVARREVVQDHPEEISRLLTRVSESVAKVNADPVAASKVIGDLGIVPEKIAAKAIPHANIVCLTGEEMKTKLEGYLRVLEQLNPKAIGGTLPAEDFYHLPEGTK